MLEKDRMRFPKRLRLITAFGGFRDVRFAANTLALFYLRNGAPSQNSVANPSGQTPVG
jgi:hypothetical protein